MDTTIDLNKIALFVRVAETQSFTTAAAALGVPKSSVSRGVAQLEQMLGVRLLQRTTRKTSLTEAGQAYYDQVSRALAGLEDARATISTMQSGPAGTVRLTAPNDIGVVVLPELIARFTRKYPGIRVELVLTARTLDLVEEGIDLAVRAGPLRDSALIAKRLAMLEAALFAAPSYLRDHGTPRTTADLAEHDCLVHRPRNGKGTWHLSTTSGREEAVEVTGKIAGDDFTFLHRMIVLGNGIGLVPWMLAARDVRRGRLVRVLPEHAGRGGALSLVYPSARHLPRRVELLRDWLVETMTPLGAMCQEHAKRMLLAAAPGAPRPESAERRRSSGAR